MPDHNFIDLTGKAFGKWTVLGRLASTKPRVRWLCRCECGSEVDVAGASLREGTSTQCRPCSTTKHGDRRRLAACAPEYGVWNTMIQRCTNEKVAKFRDYGARGIRVCDRWLTYGNFIADMGYRPTPKHSIDRINNDGNYEPGNCRWATPLEQRHNRRPRRKLK